MNTVASRTTARLSWAATAAIVLTLCGHVLAEDAKPAESAPVPARGTAAFSPADDEATLPERFRMPPQQFEYTAEQVRDFKNVRMYKVLFPSPVETAEAKNNTIHAEYFQPKKGTSVPGVIVLHILGGDFLLSETIAQHLANNGVAAMFVKMPYYGERRTSGGRRMISKDPRESAEGMRQAVLDIRRATAWLGDRPEVDERRLGITGISLGGIMSALSAGIESRLTSCAIYLGGGNFAEVLWNHADGEAVAFRKAWQEAGGSQEDFREILRPVDPVTYAPRLRGRRVLMVNATSDEVIPRPSTDALWNALDKQGDIFWLDAGHYTAARYLPAELFRLDLFFQGRLKPALVLKLATTTPELKPGQTPALQARLVNVGVDPVTIGLPEKGSRMLECLVCSNGTDFQKGESPVAESGPVRTITLSPGESQILETLPRPVLAGERAQLKLVYRFVPADLKDPPSKTRLRAVEVISNAIEFAVGK